MRRLIICVALLAGCYDPTIGNGELACAEGPRPCPSGFVCKSDGRCYRPGTFGTDLLEPDLTGVTPQPNGARCTVGGECESGFCADGVCCNVDCGKEPCKACNLSGQEGTCAELPAGEAPRAGHASCGPDDKSTCQRNGLCDGAGGCQLWDNTTECKPPSCDAATNRATGVSKCDGLGTCTTPIAITCEPYVCKSDLTGCHTSCTGTGAGQCSSGNTCNNMSCGLKPNGAMCSGPSECQSSFCVDGLCCNEACTGQCEACDVASAPGTCTPVPNLQQPHGSRTKCTGQGAAPCGGSCDGSSRTACQYPTGSCRAQSCSGSTLTLAASCSNGACPAVQTQACPNDFACANGTSCATSCSTDASCKSGTFCNAPSCLATKPLGRTCTSGAECTSTFCVDSRCCANACSGQCQYCGNTSGSCTNVTGAPQGGRAACPVGQNELAGNNKCGATCTGTSSSCVYAAMGTACTLANNTAGTCNGGTCYGTCFPAGTPVHVPGGTKPIEAIRVGDVVRSFDVLTGAERAERVLAVETHRVRALVTVALAGGGAVQTTEEHHFWVQGSGWVRASSLALGDRLLQPDGTRVEVGGLRLSPVADGGEVDVYNLVVDELDTFFVGETPVLVHSCDYVSGFSQLRRTDLRR